MRQLYSFYNRSLRLGDEASPNMDDPNWALHLSKVFELDLKRARSIAYETLNVRPWEETLLERASALLWSPL